MVNINKRHILSGIETIFKPQKVKFPPIHVQIEPIKGCNLRCITCGGTTEFCYLTFETFSKIVDAIRPLNITLSGFGEPLMHPEIFQMIAYAENRGTYINLTVNGTFLNEGTAERLVSSKLSLLSISLDAAKEETYKKMRPGANFQEVINGIRAVNKVKEKFRTKTPQIRTHLVLTRINLGELDDFISLSQELGTDAIYFQPLDLAQSKRRLHSLLVGELGAQEVHMVIQRGLKIARELNMATNLWDLDNKFPLYWKKYQLERQDHHRRCIMPWFSTYITVGGNVVPCCSLGEYASVGNLLEEDFSLIWNNDKYREFRDLLKKGERPYEQCHNCIPVTLTDILINKEKYTPGFLRFFSRHKVKDLDSQTSSPCLSTVREDG